MYLTRIKKSQSTSEHAATELTSINEVLQQGVEDNIPVRTIEAAIIQNEDVEHKVAGAADDLHHANIELAKEVTERAVIETELADTKTDLAEVRDDLSKSQAKEKETRRSSLQDALTGLPNRVSFEQDLDQGLRQAKRHGWGLAVLFIDIDKFKSVNDSYGHGLGDKVLVMMANRLRSFLRDEDTVSRWGGDEFVCLLLEVKQDADVARLAKKMAMSRTLLNELVVAARVEHATRLCDRIVVTPLQRVARARSSVASCRDSRARRGNRGWHRSAPRRSSAAPSGRRANASRWPCNCAISRSGSRSGWCVRNVRYSASSRPKVDQRERLVQAFAQAGGGPGMILGQRAGKPFELALGQRRRLLLPQASASARPTLACMSSGRCSSTFLRLCTWQRCTRALAPKTSVIARRSALAPSITHSRIRSAFKPAVDQIAQQRSHHLRFLGAAFANAEHVLVALGIEAQRDQHDAVAEVDAVDHHHRQIDAVDTPRQPLGELCAAERHEAARYRALGHRTLRFIGRQRDPTCVS